MQMLKVLFIYLISAFLLVLKYETLISKIHVKLSLIHIIYWIPQPINKIYKEKIK